MNETAVLTGDKIQMFRLLTLKSALKLECVGMKRHGQSVYAIIKHEFNLTGTKQEVLEKFTKLIGEER